MREGEKEENAEDEDEDEGGGDVLFCADGDAMGATDPGRFVESALVA